VSEYSNIDDMNLGSYPMAVDVMLCPSATFNALVWHSRAPFGPPAHPSFQSVVAPSSMVQTVRKFKSIGVYVYTSYLLL